MFLLRTEGHQLEITTGKWNNVDRSQRLCQDCNTQQIGDEYHLFTCPTMEELRQTYKVSAHSYKSFLRIMRKPTLGIRLYVRDALAHKDTLCQQKAPRSVTPCYHLHGDPRHAEHGHGNHTKTTPHQV